MALSSVHLTRGNRGVAATWLLDKVFFLFVHDKVLLLERELGPRYPVFRVNSASMPIWYHLLGSTSFAAVYLPFLGLSAHLLLSVYGLLTCPLADLKDGRSRSAHFHWPPPEGHPTLLTCFPPSGERCKLLRWKGYFISRNLEWPSGIFTFWGTD